MDLYSKFFPLISDQFIIESIGVHEKIEYEDFFFEFSISYEKKIVEIIVPTVKQQSTSHS